MRFNRYNLNQQRVRTWFAIFPVSIDGEIRWLERVYVLQEWYAPRNRWGWYNQKFVEKGYKSRLMKLGDT